MYGSLQPHESQHAKPPCPSPTPGIYPNPWPSSRWYHPAISSSVIPFSSCPQFFPELGSFPVSQLYAWNSKVLEFQSQHQSFQGHPDPGLMDRLDLLAVQGILKSLLQHHSSKASILRLWPLFTIQPSHPYMTTGKTIALTRRTSVGKVMSLLLFIYLFYVSAFKYAI